MAPTARTTWKATERRAAAIFGSTRNRCSGSSGRPEFSRSDSLHPRIFVETKLRSSDATRTLFDATAKLARAEGKVPVLALALKHHAGLLLVLRPEDLQAVAAEYQSAREAESREAVADV